MKNLLYKYSLLFNLPIIILLSTLNTSMAANTRELKSTFRLVYQITKNDIAVKAGPICSGSFVKKNNIVFVATATHCTDLGSFVTSMYSYLENKFLRDIEKGKIKNLNFSIYAELYDQTNKKSMHKLNSIDLLEGKKVETTQIYGVSSDASFIEWSAKTATDLEKMGYAIRSIEKNKIQDHSEVIVSGYPMGKFKKLACTTYPISKFKELVLSPKCSYIYFQIRNQLPIHEVENGNVQILTCNRGSVELLGMSGGPAVLTSTQSIIGVTSSGPTTVKSFNKSKKHYSEFMSESEIKNAEVCVKELSQFVIISRIK
jgi:hypothetical protein